MYNAAGVNQNLIEATGEENVFVLQSAVSLFVPLCNKNCINSCGIGT